MVVFGLDKKGEATNFASLHGFQSYNNLQADKNNFKPNKVSINITESKRSGNREVLPSKERIYTVKNDRESNISK